MAILVYISQASAGHPCRSVQFADVANGMALGRTANYVSRLENVN
jgi:hypothetical protein